MDKQAIFNKVCQHLITQNKRSIDEEGKCLYRAKDGSKCAIGCLIEDVDYHESLEGFSVASYAMISTIQNLGAMYSIDYAYSVKEKKMIETLVGEDISFLSKLQQIHDNHITSNWKTHLRYFGEDHGLGLPDCILKNAAENS